MWSITALYQLLLLLSTGAAMHPENITVATSAHSGYLATSVNKGDLAAVKFVHEAWPNIGDEFFNALEPKGAKAILKYNLEGGRVDWLGQVSTQGLGLVSSLPTDRLHLMKPETCAVFAENLQVIRDLSAIPQLCREHLLRHGTVAAPGISRIPLDWIEAATDKFISQLYAERLNGLPSEAFALLVDLGKCQYFQPLALEKLSIAHWRKVTPSCLASVRGLEMVQIPASIIEHLPGDIFSLYNGPLHKGTLQRITPAQARAYASLIPDNARICEKLHLVHLTLEAASHITPRCLLGFFRGQLSHDATLSLHWAALERPFLQFTEKMMHSIYSLPIASYQWMTPATIEKIFTSRTAMARLASHDHYTSLALQFAKLTSQHFKLLVDYNGSIAGLALLNAKSLPDDAFAHFSAADYAKLNGRIDQKFFFGDDLLVALAHHKNFDRLVTNFSQESGSHYCERLATSTDYIQRLWLREHAGPSCWNALPFKIDKKLRALMPELDRNSKTWSKFLHKHTRRWASLPPQPLSDLLQMESFCRVFKDIASLDFITKQPDQVLGVIGGKCAAHLYRLINIDIACKLADDALRFFTVEMLPPAFKLARLRPAQIAQVSEGLAKDCESHVFTTITIADLYDIDRSTLRHLTQNQLKVMFRDQSSLPAMSVSILKLAMSTGNQRLFNMALRACDSLLGSAGPRDLGCIDLIDRSRSSESTKHDYEKLLKNLELCKLSYLRAALSQGPEELRSAIIRDDPLPSPLPKLSLTFDPLQGFNLEESMALITRHSDEFASARMQISVFGFIETEWLQASWIDQLMVDLRDQITTATTHSTIRKFSWRMGRNAAYLAGLVFGKALQKKIPLTMTFDDAFWALLANQSDTNIDAYYYQAFHEEREQFLLELQINLLSISSPVYIRPFHKETLTFATLDAPSDLKMPTIHRSASNGREQVSTLDDLKLKFFVPLDDTIRAEFYHVVGGFFTGLNRLVDAKAVSLVRDPLSLRGLLQAIPLTRDSILNAVVFNDDLETVLVQSLVPNSSITVANVIRSFLSALAPRQLEKFIKICTGLSGLSSDSKLHVSRLDSAPQSSIGNKLAADSPVDASGNYAPHITVASQDEYWGLLDAVAQIQQTMILHPPAASGMTQGPGFLLSEAFSRRNLLRVYPQPAKALIDSLVLLLNTPSATFLYRN